MRKLKIVISVLASFSFVVQLPVWASWAQVDHATKDEMLRRMTDEGSSKFLSGTIGVQEAFQKFDDRNREEAVAIGIKAATDFDEARARFEAARDRVKEHSELRDELNSRLSLRSYDERTQPSALSPSDLERLRRPAQLLAKDGGATALFDSAATRARGLRDKSEKVFRAIRAGAYVPTQGADLLAEIGEDLAFGASVSAMFQK